jgi:hypothetical protein
MTAVIVVLAALAVLSGWLNYQLMRRIVCLEAAIRHETDARIAELYQLFLSKSSAEIDRFVFEGQREKDRHDYRMEKIKTQRDVRLGQRYEEPVDDGVPIEGTTF